jgi:hypothetical protein
MGGTEPMSPDGDLDLKKRESELKEKALRNKVVRSRKGTVSDAGSPN